VVVSLLYATINNFNDINLRNLDSYSRYAWQYCDNDDKDNDDGLITRQGASFDTGVLLRSARRRSLHNILYNNTVSASLDRNYMCIVERSETVVSSIIYCHHQYLRSGRTFTNCWYFFSNGTKWSEAAVMDYRTQR
jgi:hypothetical protein